MTKLISTVLVAAFAISAAPAFSSTMGKGGLFQAEDADQIIEKRRKPRVPGGSSCDDPRDLIEHPECRG
ncbi:MAG: hypothetical protein R3D97_10050 [Paracoccaceae bacterium]